MKLPEGYTVPIKLIGEGGIFAVEARDEHDRIVAMFYSYKTFRGKATAPDVDSMPNAQLFLAAAAMVERIRALESLIGGIGKTVRHLYSHETPLPTIDQCQLCEIATNCEAALKGEKAPTQEDKYAWSKDDRITELATLLVRKEDHIAELEHKVAAKEQQIAGLQAALVLRDTRAADLVAACEAKDEELMRKNAMVTALKDALAIVSANREGKVG